MQKTIFLILFTTNFLLLGNISFAQSEIPEDITTGGKAKCILKGNVPIKKGIADGNRLVILRSGDFANGSILFQRTIIEEGFSLDINTLALFGSIPDLNAFLAGRILDFQNSESDFSIRVVKQEDQSVTEVTNLLDDGTKGNLIGKVKLTSSRNNLASGSGFFIIEKTIRKVSSNNNEIPTSDNGKVSIKCNFKNIPLAIKDLE